MRRIILSLVVLVVSVAALSAAPCAPSDTSLCLNSARFEVDVSWRDSRGRTGVGQAVSITADTGYFWFFSATNIELVIKVLDARSINGKYWVFFGALSSVEYDLTVTDTATGVSKTYHNPLGQFASVGDTGAFEPAPPTPGPETVSAEGTDAPPGSFEDVQRFIDAADLAPSSAAFTPCPDAGGFLYLAGCRFRLDVHWTDSRGRHGLGQPVQLTNDTGYFWFFSDANVELMVKVLDARGVNGNFWVFFGALSNVEYTINVVDTVSGALRSYRNPQSTFASVGDTSAFRGGYRITVEPDTTRAVSAEISADAGGAVSTTAADGTVFTLEIPPNALIVDETVTMAPVLSTGSLPFAGGLVAAVDLQPSGLVLLDGATLSIHTPASIPHSEETPVAWNGAGDDFFLFPPQPAAGDLQLIIFHLGGYGLARGTDAERQVQLAREPVASDDLLSHEISPLLRQGRTAAVGAGASPLESRFSQRATADWLGETRTILEQAYQSLATEMLSIDEPARARDLFNQSRALLRRFREIGVNHDSDIAPVWDQMFAQVLRKIHERCKEDAFAIFEAVPLLRMFTGGILHERVPLPRTFAEIQPLLGCLIFKLRFESKITATAGGMTITYTVLAPQVTLRGRLNNFAGFVIDGSGSIDHSQADWTGQDPRECSGSPTFVHSPSTFSGKLYWDMSTAANRGVRLEYDPSTPPCKLTIVCFGIPVTDTNAWRPAYEGLRGLSGEVACEGTCFVSKGWILPGGKNPWAFRISSGGVAPVSEYTVFTLTHTPE